MWPFNSPKSPVLKGEKIVLRLAKSSDFAEWSQLRRANREFLTQWEPRWPPSELTRANFQARLKIQQQQFKDGLGYHFLIFLNSSHHEGSGAEIMIGGITLTQIRQGAARSGEIGYWLAENQMGKSYMRDALTLLLSYCFGELVLQRVEASSLAGNARSIGLLKRMGFRHEGTAIAYLEINGKRRDHERYGLLATEFFAVKNLNPTAKTNGWIS